MHYSRLKQNGGPDEKRTPGAYLPCYHDGGPCDDLNCGCVSKLLFCEKFCGCPIECKFKCAKTVKTYNTVHVYEY